ncbi:MarR family winged helix-turn-helix transcriptional regulator [Anaeroselena agilis]|uniref:MarR family transcriptional regulator n=1 Tax=Anaeroselena agilis TaxID=3063788 RepID=A0ABU3NY02_9FIRM|nr:MarR family transcriptional regulator [Selenomonadales bacterium 4137-cl]
MSNENHAGELRETMRLLVRRLGILERGEASCCGITMAQCHVIVELGRAKKLSLNDLAELLKLDKSTVSRSVDNLVGMGFVRRDTDAADRRYVTLALSEKGGKVFADLEKRMEKYFAEIVGFLPADKREQVLDSLALLADAIKSPDCCDLRIADDCCGVEKR